MRFEILYIFIAQALVTLAGFLIPPSHSMAVLNSTSTMTPNSSLSSTPTLDSSEKGGVEKEEDLRIRIPPPFHEGFPGAPGRRWPIPIGNGLGAGGKWREIRSVGSESESESESETPAEVGATSPGNTNDGGSFCGEKVDPCSCCCRKCWEFPVLFQSLQLCFGDCGVLHDRCQCHKSRFHPLDSTLMTASNQI